MAKERERREGERGGGNEKGKKKRREVRRKGKSKNSEKEVRTKGKRRAKRWKEKDQWDERGGREERKEREVGERDETERWAKSELVCSERETGTTLNNRRMLPCDALERANPTAASGVPLERAKFHLCRNALLCLGGVQLSEKMLPHQQRGRATLSQPIYSGAGL